MVYCGEACRKRANRLKLAADRTPAAVIPLKAAGDASGRTDDLRAVWDALIASVRAEGVLVPGSAGVPVAHPALRFLPQIDAQLLKHEFVKGGADSDDDIDALFKAALQRAKGLSA
ncbi:hypothetical protein ADK65_10505 [Streptomyces sp. NRRL B-1140]|nr:hypothetical protein ADK65_10505 [Streptomyces sp. NRRL B-1140]